METSADRPGRPVWSRAHDLAAMIVAWGLWATMTIAMVAYVGQYSRNVPYWDELAMVPVMTGAKPVSLGWAWQQHNEHRPMIPRLVMAGLYRLVGRDFRVVRHANAILLSAMAAAMLLLVRRVRGSARVTDAVLPLSILNIAQAESVLNGFAMNLVLTSMMALAVLAAAALARRGGGRILAIGLGLSMVLLPLCGGSGLVMLPPLALWLSGNLASGWWSGRRPGAGIRAFGLGVLVASSIVVALYFRGYVRPPYHPAATSMAAVASSTLMYLSLAIYPDLGSYWEPAGWMLAVIVVSTLILLAAASLRSPVERPRALGLTAVILSMLCVAVAVGISRAGLGPVAILSSRYVTLTTPLLCALYLAWLVYGKAPARAGIHLGLPAMMLLALPGGRRFSRVFGSYIRHVELRVERCLLAHGPIETLMERACPALYSDRRILYDHFKKLKAARVGAFVRFEEARIATAPDDGAGAARR